METIAGNEVANSFAPRQRKHGVREIDSNDLGGWQSTLQRECRAWLESFKVPHHIELRAALPRSSNGKIAKSELE